MAAMAAILDIRTEFVSIGPTVWEEMSFEEFQDGGHLGYKN